MSATSYPFEMAGGVPVVSAPAEIDLTTVGQLRAILFDWHGRGHATMVVDMTGTQFCDCAALRERPDAVMAAPVGREPARDDIAPVRYRRRPPGER